ncbi:MAG: hypothetical protein QE276_09330 [Cyanobium sp. D14.bin.5]|nr:hypothetical protein [Cyanobium sp. D14.bin.5]
MKRQSRLGLLALAFLAAWATGTGMGNARADDGHSAAALGVKVETLIRSDRSWNGDLLPKLNDVQAEVGEGASQSLQPGHALIETVNKMHRGVSLGPEPAVVVVVYVAPKGSPITVPAASAPKGNPNKAADEIVTVRPLTTSTSKQKLKQFVGISSANSGAPPCGIGIGDIFAGRPR